MLGFCIVSRHNGSFVWGHNSSLPQLTTVHLQVKKSLCEQMLDAREGVHNPLSDIAIHCAMGYQIIKINVMNVNEFMV